MPDPKNAGPDRGLVEWFWPLYIPGWWIVQILKDAPKGGK